MTDTTTTTIPVQDAAAKKERYRAFCATAADIPLFSQAWWLDAVAGPEHWQVALVEANGAIVASMPYVVQKKFGFTRIKQAQLTQSLGPWLAPSTAKYSKQLAAEKDLLEALAAQLPRFDHFHQNWSWHRPNWLPFHWLGFQQTTRYTYVLDDLSDTTRLWTDFQENVRREVRKAETRFGIEVRDDPTIDAFLALNRKTFARQDRQLPYSEAFVRRLDAACAARGQRKVWIARDPEGRDHAGAYVVWDANSAYYLLGGGDPDLRNSGATSLCMWTAIRDAATRTRRFDFEGSMIEPVERFFRGFGAVQKPFHQITKVPSRLLRLRQALLDVMAKGR